MKNKRILILFSTLILFKTIFSYCHYSLLNIDELKIDELKKLISINKVQKIISKSTEYLYLNYLNIFITTLINILFVSFTLYIGLLMYNLKTSFKKLISLVIKLEYVFLLPILYEIIHFKFINTTASLQDIQYFYPLSALNIVGYKGIDPWLIYPLQTLNLFEVAYWLLLSYYIGKIASPTKNIEENKYPMDFGLKIVASSYGSFLLLWIVVVMFFTLNYS